MNICVHGIDFRNYGALMMLSAVERFASAQNPPMRIYVPFTNGNTYKRAMLGAGTALVTTRYRVGLLPVGGLTLTRLATFIPRSFLERHRLIRVNEIDLHLDASGYAYGDPWRANRARRMAMLASHWSKSRAPLIVLPQAFGPFRSPSIAEACFRYLSNALHIFARDLESQNHLLEIGIPSSMVSVSPDFTPDPAAHVPGWSGSTGKVALVPNSRFVDTAGMGNSYVGQLVACIKRLQAKGLKVELVIHEEQDAKLADEIANLTNSKVRISAGHTESVNVFRAYDFVISCRYHAIVAALGAEVPTIALGWSHKYQGLMEDYSIADLCCDLFDTSGFDAAVDRIIKEPDLLRASIASARQDILRANARMWERVLQLSRNSTSN